MQAEKWAAPRRRYSRQAGMMYRNGEGREGAIT